MSSPPLPPDGHTHTQWSWDAASGSMEGSCARAVELGLPAIAFTEHVDAVRWAVLPTSRDAMRRRGFQLDDHGRFVPPPLDVEGYLDTVERCRQRFPTLRIVTGAEIGEPHWFPTETRALLARGAFERVLGSVHSLTHEGRAWATDDLLESAAPGSPDPREVVRRYLAETLAMVTRDTTIAVLAHIDFPFRQWPRAAGEVSVTDFEEEFRAVLRELAASGRALEVNTRVPLDAEVVRWWRQEGGTAVTFGSDAHEPSSVGAGFREAAAMVEAHGFGPGAHAHEAWVR